MYVASSWYNTTNNATNWDTAYNWGDHASAGYQAAATALTTSTTFGGDVSGTYNAIVVADDSHNHIIGNVDGLQTALDGKAPLTGTGASGTWGISVTGSSGSTTGNAATATTAGAVVKTVTGTSSAELVRGNMADNDQFRILVGGTASNAGYAEIATADDGTEPIYVRQYTGTFTTLQRTATLLDGSGNTYFPGAVSASTFIGALVGNATTATSATSAATLTTARTINGVSFNGSSNIMVEPYVEDDNTTNATRYLTFVDNTTAGYKRLNEDSELTYNPSTNTLTAGIFSGALSGNATTATTLQTARTINGVSFNGSANIVVESYIEDDNSTNATRYLTFVDNTTASYKRLNEDSNLTYNPSTNTLTTGTFAGNLSGNASTVTNGLYTTSTINGGTF